MSKESKTTRSNRVFSAAALRNARIGNSSQWRFRPGYTDRDIATVAADVPVIGGKTGVIERMQHYAPYDPWTHERTNADCTPHALIAVKVGGERIRTWLPVTKLVIRKSPRPTIPKRRNKHDERYRALAKRAIKQYRRNGGLKQRANEPGIYDTTYLYSEYQPKPPGWLKGW